MDYLMEVLSSTDDADVENIHNTLSLLTMKVLKYKNEVIDHIDNVYEKYSKLPEFNDKLQREVNTISKDISVIREKVEKVFISDLSDKQSQVDTLKAELDRCHITSSLIASVLEVHEKLLSVNECKSDNNYVQAAFELAHVDTLLNDLPCQEELEVITSLKSNVMLEKVAVGQALTAMLEEMLLINEGKAGLMQLYTMKVHKNSRELQDVINTLGILNKLNPFLSNFVNSFWLCICKPILSNITQIRTAEEDDFHILTVVVKRTTTLKYYKEAFDKLVETFTFVRSHLDFEISKNSKFYSHIGNGIEVNLSQTLQKETLLHFKASKPDFREVVDATRNFQNRLVALEMLACENPILEYVNGMDLTLANHKCDQYTSEAITMMKKDLHDMIEVGVHFDSDNPLTGDQFPQCTISKSSIELLEEAEKALQRALTDSPMAATRTICAMQSIFYQYGSIVYGHHEKLLETIPQQVVLYRNNCMYLAHHLSLLNEAYSSQFDKAVLPVPPIFKDQPHQLRTVGGDIFLGYVEVHIRAMERVLIEYKFESHRLSENMSADIDKCFRQCLRQYELLKTVWHKILPHAVYNKTIGYLVNSFCRRLLDTVLEAADISVQNCELLVDVFKIVLTRTPKLFTDPDEINLYVNVWQKFGELVFVLTADLASISDRWKNGSLSTHFVPDEVKHLIRALFQTTDRRAHVLSQIVSVHKY